MGGFLPGGDGFGAPGPWCPDGWVWDAFSCTCVPIDPADIHFSGPGPEGSCPSGFIWDPVSCSCRPEDCGPGFIWDELSGQCLPIDSGSPGGSPPTPGPQHPPPTPVCPPGYVLDLVSSKCKPVAPPPVPVLPPAVITPPPPPGGDTGGVYADARDTSNAFVSVAKIISGGVGWL